MNKIALIWHVSTQTQWQSKLFSSHQCHFHKIWIDLNLFWLMTRWFTAGVMNDDSDHRHKLTNLMATCHSAINLETCYPSWSNTQEMNGVCVCLLSSSDRHHGAQAETPHVEPAHPVAAWTQSEHTEGTTRMFFSSVSQTSQLQSASHDLNRQNRHPDPQRWVESVRWDKDVFALCKKKTHRVCAPKKNMSMRNQETHTYVTKRMSAAKQNKQCLMLQMRGKHKM